MILILYRFLSNDWRWLSQESFVNFDCNIFVDVTCDFNEMYFGQKFSIWVVVVVEIDNTDSSIFLTRW